LPPLRAINAIPIKNTRSRQTLKLKERQRRLL